MHEITRIFRPSGHPFAPCANGYGPHLSATSPLSTLFHVLSIPPGKLLLAQMRKRPVPPPAP
ncbi:hypothetical protein G3435_00980 [Pseudomonas sp. MAFF212428]|uniref:Uncharacterized protein n=1 Tax=Pseudomonas brassicae TaxID=2708063 RepID=A0A6M0CT86_9PSED|nr:hypothetical protein [Pseudomonas brassicae]